MIATNLPDPMATTSPGENKPHATLIARAALADVTLRRNDDGSWLASRWGWDRRLPDAAAVDSFLRLVTGART